MARIPLMERCSKTNPLEVKENLFLKIAQSPSIANFENHYKGLSLD